MAIFGDANFDPVHILVAALGIVGATVSTVIGFLVKRALSGFDKRQDENEKRIERTREDLAAETARSWNRHDAEHTRIHQENEEEHRRIRDDVSSNSQDIARLLERTKDR